jgi:2-oxoisovalerate ferredoxin oxidoreductase alpha subunit
MCDLTMDAFRLSCKYRNPAVVLADAVLGQMMEFLTFPEKVAPRPDLSWAVQGDAATRRNLVTSIYLDIDKMEAHNVMLQKKYASMQEDARGESYRTEDAEIILTGYGTCARIARTAVDRLRSQGVKAGLFRPITLFPFPQVQLNKAVKGKKVLVVELSNGQYHDDVRLHLDSAAPVGLCNRMGGNMMAVEDVAAAAKKMLEGHR